MCCFFLSNTKISSIIMLIINSQLKNKINHIFLFYFIKFLRSLGLYDIIVCVDVIKTIVFSWILYHRNSEYRLSHWLKNHNVVLEVEGEWKDIVFLWWYALLVLAICQYFPSYRKYCLCLLLLCLTDGICIISSSA